MPLTPRSALLVAGLLSLSSARSSAGSTDEDALPSLIDRQEACHPSARPDERVYFHSAGPPPHTVRQRAKRASAAPPPPVALPQEAEALDDAPARSVPRHETSHDWGGTIHLSNDDSMSLASAQRILFALEHGQNLPVEHIRPHELLNYFQFDSPHVPADKTFAVAASAEQTDQDTLSLALAVQGAVPDRAPLDLTLLIDRSGSMHAEGRMSYTKRALRLLSDQLVAGDRIDLVLFDNTPCVSLENFVVGRDDPRLLHEHIERIVPRNSTDLDAGLRAAYDTAIAHDEGDTRARRVMLFTDAMLNTGDVNPATVTEIGRALDRHDIRLTGVGVGRDFRDDVLNALTEKGKGAYVYLGSERVVDRLFAHGFDALVQTIAHDVRFTLQLPQSLGMQRFYGEESSTQAADIQPVHFHAGNSQLFLQDLAIQGGLLKPAETIRLDMTWTDPLTAKTRSETFQTTIRAALQADPHNARKGRALMAWTDMLYARALNADPCGAPWQAYQASLTGLQDDAELAYVSELMTPWCGRPVAATPPASWTKVRVDSDQPIDEVALTCGGHTTSQRLTLSDSVVRLSSPGGQCDVVLHGQIPLKTPVEVPAHGGDLRCVIRGGRARCS